MFFFKPSWMSQNEKKAIRAVEKLTDQKELIRVVRESKNDNVRSAAVKKITDQKVLVDLALTDSSHWIRTFAVEGLTDQAALVDVLMKSDSVGFIEAVTKISDQAVLANLALNSRYCGVQRKAIRCLSDQRVLEEIASNDFIDAWSRWYAAIKLNNQGLAQSVFLKLAIGDDINGPTKNALQILVSAKNEEALLEVAKFGKLEQIKIDAIKSIESKELLKKSLPALDGSVKRLVCGNFGHTWSAPKEVADTRAELVNGQKVSLTTIEFLCICSRCGDTKFVSNPN